MPDGRQNRCFRAFTLRAFWKETMIRAVLSASLGLVLAGLALAINKCTGADGKTVFQDAPAWAKARPSP